MKRNFEVMYFSKTGNTEKVAEVIANRLGVIAESVKDRKESSKGTLLFLGSPIYAGKIPREITEFIEKNAFKGRSVALFGTSGDGQGKQLNIIADKLKRKGAKIKGKYDCIGKSFFIFNRGHPSDHELLEAERFAERMKKA